MLNTTFSLLCNHIMSQFFEDHVVAFQYSWGGLLWVMVISQFLTQCMCHSTVVTSHHDAEVEHSSSYVTRSMLQGVMFRYAMGSGTLYTNALTVKISLLENSTRMQYGMW